jgi:hypothetical protein
MEPIYVQDSDDDDTDGVVVTKEPPKSRPLSRKQQLSPKSTKTENKIGIDMDTSMDFRPGINTSTSTEVEPGIDKGTFMDFEPGIDMGTSTDVMVGVNKGTFTDFTIGVTKGTSTEDLEIPLTRGLTVPVPRIDKDEIVFTPVMSYPAKSGKDMIEHAKKFIEIAASRLVCLVAGDYCNFSECQQQIILKDEIPVNENLEPYLCDISGHVFLRKTKTADIDCQELAGEFCDRCDLFQHQALGKLYRKNCILCSPFGIPNTDPTGTIEFALGRFVPTQHLGQGIAGVALKGNWFPIESPETGIEAVVKISMCDDFITAAKDVENKSTIRNQRDLVYETDVTRLAGMMPGLEKTKVLGLTDEQLRDVNLAKVFAFGLVNVPLNHKLYVRSKETTVSAKPLGQRKSTPTTPHAVPTKKIRTSKESVLNSAKPLKRGSITHCFVMEYGGVPIEEYMKQTYAAARPVNITNYTTYTETASTVAYILRGAIRAQTHLVSRGMLHTDMHTLNILCKATGIPDHPYRTTLIDFGRTHKLYTKDMPNTLPQQRWSRSVKNSPEHIGEVDKHLRYVVYHANAVILKYTAMLSWSSDHDENNPHLYGQGNNIWGACYYTYCMLDSMSARVGLRTRKSAKRIFDVKIAKRDSLLQFAEPKFILQKLESLNLSKEDRNAIMHNRRALTEEEYTTCVSHFTEEDKALFYRMIIDRIEQEEMVDRTVFFTTMHLIALNLEFIMPIVKVNMPSTPLIKERAVRSPQTDNAKLLLAQHVYHGPDAVHRVMKVKVGSRTVAARYMSVHPKYTPSPILYL